MVKKFYLTFDGKEFIKEFSGEMEIIAPYSSLLQNKKTSFSVKCIEDTKVIFVDWSFIQSLFSKDIAWMEFGKKIAELHFVNREAREAEFLKNSAKERLTSFQKNYPQLIERLKKQDIASYLGITPVSLSRILD